jgi:hypothetical protein
VICPFEAAPTELLQQTQLGKLEWKFHSSRGLDRDRGFTSEVYSVPTSNPGALPANATDLKWWARQDLNLEPADYEPDALTVELRAPMLLYRILYLASCRVSSDPLPPGHGLGECRTPALCLRRHRAEWRSPQPLPRVLFLGLIVATRQVVGMVYPFVVFLDRR